MDLSIEVLGSGTVQKLAAAQTEALFQIGTDTLSREQLADRGCYNFVAARRLSENLKTLGAKNLKDLFERFPPRDIALPHVGVISLAVLGAAFEAKGIGGKTPLANYVKKHTHKVVTFHTVKARVRKEDEDGKRSKRARRARKALNHAEAL